METGFLFCPKWHCSLLGLLMVVLCFSRTAKSEITCRSCQAGNNQRPQELLLKFDPGFNGEVFGTGKEAPNAESQRRWCAEGSAKCVRRRAVLVMKRNARNLQPNGDTGDGYHLKMKVSPPSGQQERTEASTAATGRRKRLRRNTGGKSDGRLSASSTPRRATRWSGEERRAAAARQEEAKLNSSTFALTGDSSHNQAMVLWSGQNSSVSASLVSSNTTIYLSIYLYFMGLIMRLKLFTDELF